MTPDSSPIPLYYQVSSVLRQRILDGSYDPGAKLPPEDDLAAEFDVSRATIRQAVGELVAADMLSRRQGRGTFVRQDATEGNSGQVFSGTIYDLLKDVRRTKVREVEVEHDARLPRRFATELRLKEPVGTVVRRTRLMDGDPFAYTINYMPDSIGKQLSKRELRASGLMQLMESKKIVIDSARQTIRAELADPTVSEAIGIALGAAVLYVERTLFNPAGEPISFVRSWYRADRYDYTVTFRRGDELGLRAQFA